MADLTERELDAITAAAIGMPRHIAARALGVSERTTVRLQYKATRKLGGICTVHAVALAAARGLIPVEALRQRSLPQRDQEAGT